MKVLIKTSKRCKTKFQLTVGFCPLGIRILTKTQKYCETHFQLYDGSLFVWYEDSHQNTRSRRVGTRSSRFKSKFLKPCSNSTIPCFLWESSYQTDLENLVELEMGLAILLCLNEIPEKQKPIVKLKLFFALFFVFYWEYSYKAIMNRS